MAHQMALSIQQELRKLPGNSRCVDCQAPYPQWATVSYGTFMCLECSGRHRGLGVHISFVRSVTMDSWTDLQIKKMQIGGNDNFRAAFQEAGVPGDLSIKQKYNTPQAEAYRNRIQSIAEGKGSMPIPKWDASCLPSNDTNDDASGVEPLKGETEEQYVARQMKLKEEARERMRAKFGSGGMQGIGSGGSTGPSSQNDYASSLGSAFSMLSTTVSSAASSATSALKDQGLSEKVSLGWSAVSNRLNDPALSGNVKSTASSGWNALSSGASSLWKSAQSLYDDTPAEETSMFPRTNPNLHTSNKFEGMGSNSSYQPPPATTTIEDDDAWLKENLSKAKANLETNSTPSIQSAASTAPISSSSTTSTLSSQSSKPKKKKPDEDFFANFGV